MGGMFVLVFVCVVVGVYECVNCVLVCVCGDVGVADVDVCGVNVVFNVCVDSVRFCVCHSVRVMCVLCCHNSSEKNPLLVGLLADTRKWVRRSSAHVGHGHATMSALIARAFHTRRRTGNYARFAKQYSTVRGSFTSGDDHQLCE